MDLKVLASGNTFYEINSQIGALLVDAGVCSQVEKPAPKPKPALPEWAVCTQAISGTHYIRHVVGQETTIFDGDPSRVMAVFPTCPESIASDYMTLKTYHAPRKNIWGE